MWIVSNEDKSVASTWGAVIHIKAGEPRQVGHDLVLLCLQAGCVEIKDHEDVEEPVVEVVEEVVVEEIKKKKRKKQNEKKTVKNKVKKT